MNLILETTRLRLRSPETADVAAFVPLIGATKLTAGYMTDNPASGRVLEKLGFVHTDDAPYHSVSRGGEVPAHRVARTRERFENASLTP